MSSAVFFATRKAEKITNISPLSLLTKTTTCKTMDKFSQSFELPEEYMEQKKISKSPKQPPLKRCTGCKMRRRRHFFSVDRSRKTGLKDRCKDCESLRLKEYYKRVVYPKKNKEPLTPDLDMREI